MRRVFIVVGHTGSRKSSTIRALTGTGPPKIYQVRITNDEILNIYVHHSSLQEARISPAAFITQVEKFVEECVEEFESDPDVLVALRTSSSQNREFPEAREYASQFMQAGWQIAGVVYLHGGPRSPLIADTPVPIQFYGSKNMANNEITHQIRAEWGWL